MKRTRVLLAALITGSSGALCLAGWMLTQTLDGITGVFCIRDNTQYSAAFSDAAFRQVSPGMTEVEVQRLLGEPLRRFVFLEPNEDSDTGNYYSYRMRSGPYRLRTVLLFRGKVTRAIAECTFD